MFDQHLGSLLASPALPLLAAATGFAACAGVYLLALRARVRALRRLVDERTEELRQARERGDDAVAARGRSAERARIAADLRNALVRDEFILHYQPQVDLGTGAITGMEALIRWQHPELGLLPPARFVALAEELDLIVPIGAWVMRAACAQNRAWQKAGLGTLRVAVNLSAGQFYRHDLAASITGMLAQTGLSPFDLELELTESLVMQDVEQAAGILNRLKAIGVHVSIDDFGTGYSSLAYLKQFPVDTLKMDKSFVREIAVDPDDAMIATSIIALAHSLKLQVIAEGVETAAQLAFLRRHGCDLMQGYYFSEPLPAAEFEAICRTGMRLPPAPDGTGERARKLLIVDDEVHVASALRRLLRDEHYSIVTATTAREGLDALAMHDVQVIVCDQRMPAMTGIEFFSKVKDMYPNTIRIMLTGYADLDSVVDAINHGAVHRFFVKPWNDNVLREHIREAFYQYRMQHGGPSPVSPGATG